MDKPIRRHRLDFLKMTRWGAKFGIPFSLLLVSVGVYSQFKFEKFPDWIDLSLCLVSPIAVFTILANLVTLLSWLIPPVRVYPDGLGLFNYWGRYKRIKWKHLKHIRGFDQDGFPSLLFDVEGHSQPFFLPLWIADREELKSLVAENASPRHPIVEHLELAS